MQILVDDLATYICLGASEDANAVEVLQINLEHNHEISKDLYESLLRQRLLPDHVLEEVKSPIKLKANNKLLKQKIEQDTGKKVTLKDISNIKFRTRLPLNGNDIDSVVEFLQKVGDSNVDIVDEEEKFKGSLYQDAYMRNMYMQEDFLDRRYDKPLSIYSRLVGMTI